MHPVPDRISRSKKKRKKPANEQDNETHEATNTNTSGSSVLSSLWGRLKPAADPSPIAPPAPSVSSNPSTSEIIQLPPPAATLSLAQKWKVFLEEHKGMTIASENRKPWPTAEAQVPSKVTTSISPSSSPSIASSTAASTTSPSSPSSSTSSSSSITNSSSISLPSSPIGGVTITLLNTYGDMSEVSGLVLCPGFARPFAPTHKPHDPVPSHLHPEAISPTLLPPVPTLEERKEALEAANAINEQEEKQSEKEVVEAHSVESSTHAGNSSVAPTAHTLTDVSNAPATTSIANKLITRLTKKPTIESFAPTAAAPPPTTSTPVSSVVSPSLTPSASAPSGWLSYFSRSSSSNAGTTTALDSISYPHAATTTQSATHTSSRPVQQQSFGDRDHEMDLRPSPLPRLKSPRRFRTAATKQPLHSAAENSHAVTQTSPAATTGETQTNHRRSSSLMNQLWFGDSSSNKPTSSSKSTTKLNATQLNNSESKRTPSEKERKDAKKLSDNTATTTSTSSSSSPAGSGDGLGSSIRRLASSALFWTLGPFPPAPAAQTPAIEKPTSTDTTAPPPPAPPVEIIVPPVWTTLRRVVIIGVHGWSLMGGMLSDKPIMVSQKFCAMAQRALAVYCKERGMNLSQIQVCTIPLHGHGKVEQRVENYLHHQLPVYQPYISTADAIFVIGHSQGCLVSVSVLHQLVLQGWIDPSKQHVSMQLMAGLHHGPFPDLLSDLYAATKELFSFCYVDSEVHRRYMQGLHYLMENRVKVICVGSVHDQAVPLYSSLLQAFPSNPNLIRALYIDYSTYQPDFPYALLSLVVYLMNSGIHGRGRVSGAAAATSAMEDLKSEHAAAVYVEALVHISGWLRGGLLEKNGGAHSAVHRLTDCYNLAMEWSLSGRGVDTAIHVHSHSFAIWAPYFQESFTHTKMNRYMLTVRFRELFSLLPLTSLNSTQELSRLYQLYVLWQPRTRQFKLLKEAFAPLFEIQLQKDVDTGSSKEKEKHDEIGEKIEPTDKNPVEPVPSVSDMASMSLPSNLLLLLQPPRLSNLPVSFPTSWQMNAETHAAPLIENPTDSPQVPAPPAPGRKNRRLRHVKENVEDQSPQPAAPAATSSSNEKLATDTNTKPAPPVMKSQQVAANTASQASGLATSTYFKLRAKI